MRSRLRQAEQVLRSLLGNDQRGIDTAIMGPQTGLALAQTAWQLECKWECVDEGGSSNEVSADETLKGRTSFGREVASRVV